MSGRPEVLTAIGFGLASALLLFVAAMFLYAGAALGGLGFTAVALFGVISTALSIFSLRKAIRSISRYRRASGSGRELAVVTLSLSALFLVILLSLGW